MVLDPTTDRDVARPMSMTSGVSNGTELFGAARIAYTSPKDGLEIIRLR